MKPAVSDCRHAIKPGQMSNEDQRNQQVGTGIINDREARRDERHIPAYVVLSQKSWHARNLCLDQQKHHFSFDDFKRLRQNQTALNLIDSFNCSTRISGEAPQKETSPKKTEPLVMRSHFRRTIQSIGDRGEHHRL